MLILDNSDDDSSDNEAVGAETPPLTKHIGKILKDYGGEQILKVRKSNVFIFIICCVWCQWRDGI